MTIQEMNVIAHPRLFETVRFPMRDKSETLSLHFATHRDLANIVKLTQNNIRLKNIVFFALGFYNYTIIIIRKEKICRLF